MNKYTEALKKGHEVVIVSKNANDDSAIFYMNKAGDIYSYSRNIGLIKRTKTLEHFAKHFERTEQEGATLYIRGLW